MLNLSKRPPLECTARVASRVPRGGPCSRGGGTGLGGTRHPGDPTEEFPKGFRRSFQTLLEGMLYRSVCKQHILDQVPKFKTNLPLWCTAGVASLGPPRYSATSGAAQGSVGRGIPGDPSEELSKGSGGNFRGLLGGYVFKYLK